MREIVFFIASFAGAAMLTALAVLNPSQSPFWEWVLNISAAILCICAIALFIDIIRRRVSAKEAAAKNTTRRRGAKLITLGQSIIFGSALLALLAIIGTLVGVILMFIGDRQNAAQHANAIGAVVTAWEEFKGLITAKTPIAKPEQDRVFVPPELTPERLLSFYHDNTSIQAAELTKGYIGQWMQITETVRNVGASTGRFVQVSFEKNYTPPLTWFDYADVYCMFREPHIDRLKILKRGDKITVIGQISTIDPLVLNLDNCEIKYPPA